jgi:hypothetical protein
MIQPGTYDITIQQNANWDTIFQLKDSTGNGVNLTGSSVQAEIWTEGKRSKLADFTQTWVDRAIGKFKLALDDSVTATLPDSGYYDILVTDSTGVAYYWLRGKATLDLGYTE